MPPLDVAAHARKIERMTSLGPIPLWILTALPAALLATACAANPAVGEVYTDWDRAGGCVSGDTQPWGVSVGGAALGPCMFPGRFVWITYDALWCTNCDRQLRATGAAARRGPENTVFVVVVGGGRHPHQSATPADLRERVRAFELDPLHVVSEGTTQRMLPQHALIGPDGHTWLRHVGELDADAMLATLDAFQGGGRQPPAFDR